jgi:hypothetical protein
MIAASASRSGDAGFRFLDIQNLDFYELPFHNDDSRRPHAERSFSLIHTSGKTRAAKAGPNGW